MEYTKSNYHGYTKVESMSIIEQSKLDYFLENFEKVTEEELRQIVESKTK